MKDKAPKCACGNHTHHISGVCAGCRCEANANAAMHGQPKPFPSAGEPDAYMNAIKHERVPGMMK